MHHSPTPHPYRSQGKNTVFVGGISYKVSEQDLRTCFEIYGAVDDVFIVRDPEHDYASKGYGFVTFEDHANSERVKTQEHIYLKGKVMNIGTARRRTDKYSNGDSASLDHSFQHHSQYSPPHFDHQQYPGSSSRRNRNHVNSGQHTSSTPPHEHTEEYILSTLSSKTQNHTDTSTASTSTHPENHSQQNKHPLRHGGEKEVSVQQ